jgi:tRNA threonylcarbamoyladenosine modification (KEOPS) complex  Pcc1 subunit
MESVTFEDVLAQIRAVPGVMSADMGAKRLLIKVAAKDWFPIRRRVEAWLQLCATPPGVRWELDDAASCGAYD